MRLCLGGDPAVAVECNEEEAEHVECRKAGSQRTEAPEAIVEIAVEGVGECLPEYLVLAEKSGKRGDPGNCDSGDEEGPVSPRHMRLQSTHVAHVLWVLRRMGVVQG